MNTIFAGGKPITRLGKHQFRMLDFALRFPGWHSYKTDAATLRIIASLEKRRVIEVNRATGQFKFAQS